MNINSINISGDDPIVGNFIRVDGFNRIIVAISCDLIKCLF